MKKAPTTITKSTTPTLIAVMTALTRDDNLVPNASSTVNTATISRAPQSTFSGPNSTVPPENPKTVPRYVDQLLETTAAPTANSRIRSQPMTHAMNSPNVAYENVYALPATGTVDANSA